MTRARLYKASRLESAIEPFDWSFARMRAGDIAAHWSGLTAKNPSLFNGRILLCRNPRLEGDCFRASYFETDFANFIAWRDFGFPDRDVFNGFGMAALQSSDGAFLLGEMGVYTSTAGQCYFPAGTPDRSDIRDNSVDLAESVLRELREETGLIPADCLVQPGWTIILMGQRAACFRDVRLRQNAAAAVVQIQEFLATDPQPELARMRIVRQLSDIEGLRTPDFIEAFFDYVFGAAT